jgi:hypothetical protein
VTPFAPVREFLFLLGGAAVGCALGGGFGALVGIVSPEALAFLAHPHPIAAPVNLGAAAGMVCGLLLGTAAMAAGRFLSAVRHVADRLPGGPRQSPR